MLPLTLRHAIKLADELAELLRPGCLRVEVADTERYVKDVELLCIPNEQPPDTFVLGGAETLFDAHLVELARQRELSLNRETGRVADGPRYKKLIFRKTAAIDLFICRPPASWGALLAIRTGPKDFSHLLVTARAYGGAMPDYLRQREGCLWNGAARLDTAEEADYFRALGIPCWNPEQRSARGLEAYLERTRQHVSFEP